MDHSLLPPADELRPTSGEQLLPVPARERGVVLMAVLVMVGVLAVFGAAASLRTSMDLREGSASRISRAAYRVSETGTMASASLAAQMQAGFADYVAAKNAKTLTMTDMGANLLATAKDDNSFGTELNALGGMDFRTVVEEADAATNVPGYDAGRFCFRTFRMTTTSRIGAATPQTVRDKLLTGETAMVATMTVGPAPCGN